MLVFTVLLAVQTPTPDAIWAGVVDAYKAKKSFSCSYTTRQLTPAKTVYRGTVAFTREKSLKFVLQDLGEKCRAGEDWSPGAGATTWVSPASFRGYNDTLTARHPYVILALLRGEMEPAAWKPEFKKGKATVTLTRDDGWSFVIDPKKDRLVSFRGPELYNEERICETTIR